MIRAARLDHMIVETDDIVRVKAEWHARGFPEAWPIGPFWPHALTAGIAVGSYNLEFLEPLDRPAANGPVTLVFEPAATDEGDWSEKWESDPALLRMRGFRREDLAHPGLICRNQRPEQNDFPDHFFCAYAPALKARLTRLPVPNPLGPVIAYAPILPDHLRCEGVEWRAGSPQILMPDL